jgi:hypothetical protein
MVLFEKEKGGNGLVNKKWDVPSQNIKIHKFGCQSMLQTTPHLLLCIFWVNTHVV